MQKTGNAGASVTVSAILAYHWYDEIEAGRKRTEYREICDYWDHLLWDGGRRKSVKLIKFSRGYTQRKMIWEVKRIDRNEAEGVYEIHLGKRQPDDHPTPASPRRAIARAKPARLSAWTAFRGMKP